MFFEPVIMAMNFNKTNSIGTIEKRFTGGKGPMTYLYKCEGIIGTNNLAVLPNFSNALVFWELTYF
jgi:hypothetical protein